MIFIEINQNLGEQTEFLFPFVITILVVWLALVFFSYKKYGWKMTAIYFLPMILAALFIESAGVASGRYYYPGYLLYMSVVGGGVPLIIILAWSANLFLFLHIGKYVTSKFYDKYNYFQVVLISFLAGIVGVCLDLLEDPIAHHNKWWVWKGSLTGVKFFGVPIINFIGWFFLIFFMSIATILIERSSFSENRKVLISISSVSITGVIIFIVHGIALRLFQMMGFA